LIDGRIKSPYIIYQSIPKPNQPHIKLEELVESFRLDKIFRTNGEEVENAVTNEVSYTLVISENKRHECPRIQINILDQEIFALVDTGCEMSIMNEQLYNGLRHKGFKCLELPAQNINLVSAFNRKSNRIKKQALLDFKIGNANINQVVLLSPQLLTDTILGLDFLMEYLTVINFAERHISLNINGECTQARLIGVRNTTEILAKTEGEEKGMSEQNRKQLSEGEENGVSSRQSDRREDMEFTSGRYAVCSTSEIELNALANDKDDQSVEEYRAAEHEIGERSKGIKNTEAGENAVRCVVTHGKAKSEDMQKTPMRKETEQVINDDRDISAENLSMKVNECRNLSHQQQIELYEVLVKYKPHLTKRPGRCTNFEYAFQIVGDTQNSANSRPIPFALREQVREQIQVMLKDGILEESFSEYLNPLTLVVRDKKPLRICVDARRINQQMVADRTKVLPLREQLQKFHGARYITSLDLSCAFLQVPLKKESRQWTAFQFQGKVYQFQSVPFGMKNSLAAFIRAIEKVFGDDEINNHVVMYVDDLLIHSPTFSEHLKHLDKVLHKLTTAGFTINAAKCQFCKPEIKFLGHIISDKTVRPDNERIEALLRYPTPKNQRQLRKFLGVCNFHQQFIVNYAFFVEPLLVLLRKGNKWRWTAELQCAFETLRAKFAEIIFLVHPDEEKGWVINTDASGKAIGSVLMQQNEHGSFSIISTASRVLKPVEQRYTTCEKELLSIVYALQRFKIHIYGRKVILYTDNQAITFLHKCVITSNRVARWMMEIQQYDLEIRHIKGVNNHLADILSRSPRELTDEETRNLARPDQIMVHRIQIYEDKTLKKELQTLATLQDADKRLAAIKEKVTSHPITDQHRYKLQGSVLYCRGGKTQQRWRAMLPDNLEQKLLKYVHLSLGHLGVDKCSEEIKYIFHVHDLGRKLRKYISCCDVCQKVKHPNRAIEVEEKHHFAKKPGDVCAIDVYGNLPISRGGVRYILVCLDVFSRFIKLYALKANTTRSCLNKMVNQYFAEVITQTTPHSSDHHHGVNNCKNMGSNHALFRLDIRNQILVSDI
jgi:hypothetical protein